MDKCLASGSEIASRNLFQNSNTNNCKYQNGISEMLTEFRNFRVEIPPAVKSSMLLGVRLWGFLLHICNGKHFSGRN